MSRATIKPAPFGVPDPIVAVRGPACATMPSITPNFAAVGATLTCDRGQWTGDATITFAYQWFRSGVAIAGATSATYTRASDDVGQEVSCRVTASNSVASAIRVATAQSRPSVYVPPGGGGTLPATSILFDFTLNSAPLILTGGGGGGSAPSAPTISGMTLLADWDLGLQSAGAWPGPIAPIAGSVTGARIAVGASAPTIGAVVGARLGAITDGVDDWLSVTGLLASLLPTNPDVEFTIAAAYTRMNAGLGAGVVDISRGTQSGNLILNRYSLRTNTTNVVASRADGSNTADVTSAGAAPSVGGAARSVMVNSNNGDQKVRIMTNGGTKSESAARSVTASGGSWTLFAIGARMENVNGTTMSNFSAIGLERLWVYLSSTPNSATNANMDVLEAALATYYT